MSTSQPIPGTRAVHRVLSLLKVFSDEKGRLNLTEISRRAGLSKATAHRMLSVLEQEGFLTRSAENGEFQLGPEMIVLGARALQHVDLRGVARPELRFLAETSGEDASLESLVGSEVLILDEEKGRSLIGLTTEVGTRWPAHATATGKVLLAGAEEPMPEPEGGLAASTAHTITSWERLTETLAEVREKGFATNIEELEYGYISVAAPLKDMNGKTVAALSLGGSAHRVTRDRIPELAALVMEAASRISDRLGHRDIK
ncbi:MAG: IclR family transcriptional regulator [Longimicrobiales bacterium]